MVMLLVCVVELALTVLADMGGVRRTASGLPGGDPRVAPSLFSHFVAASGPSREAPLEVSEDLSFPCMDELHVLREMRAHLEGFLALPASEAVECTPLQTAGLARWLLLPPLLAHWNFFRST